MAKTRRAPSLVVRAPRYASRRIRPALAAEIRRIVKQSDTCTIDLDAKLVANDPTHPLGISSDNASEWNSLLISARAERGPQWDVATQRFMVDHGSPLYFDPTPLTFVEEPTPAPEEPAGPSPADPSQSWQADPRFTQYTGGNGNGSGNLSNLSTPPRTSLRLQHQQHQQHQHHQHQQHQHQQHQLQHHQQHPHQSLNGYGNGVGITNPYPYGLTNGRAPEQQQQHYPPVQTQVPVQVQTPHSYYDTHSQVQSQSQTPGHASHGMTNGIALAGVGNPMMARQMSMGSNMGPGMGSGMGSTMGSGMGPSMSSGMGPSMGSGMGPSMGSGLGSGMGSGIGMGMEYGGGHMAGSPEDVRRRTRSQQEGHMMEMGW